MSRHVGEMLRAYVDGDLAGPARLAVERHLVVCLSCRSAVDQERLLVASLRGGPGPQLSPGLQSMLLALGDRSPAAVSMPAPGPAAAALFRLPTVAPRAPAMHRSARRSAGLAALAASGAVAVAWGFATVAPRARVDQTQARLAVAVASPTQEATISPGPSLLLRLATRPSDQSAGSVTAAGADSAQSTP